MSPTFNLTRATCWVSYLIGKGAFYHCVELSSLTAVRQRAREPSTHIVAGEWGKMKHTKLTTLPNIFIHAVCQFYSIAFAI